MIFRKFLTGEVIGQGEEPSLGGGGVGKGDRKLRAPSWIPLRDT